MQIRSSFHVFLIGLDKKSFNIKQLYQEIQLKLEQSVGKIKAENIMILDHETLLSNLMVLMLSADILGNQMFLS